MADGDDDAPKGWAGFWTTLQKELQSPWDWAAACAGAAGGLIVSGTVLHADLGYSVGGGALAAVSARKAGAASLRRQSLKKRTLSLAKIVGDWEKPIANPAALKTLAVDIQRDLSLLDAKVMQVADYEKTLARHVSEFRRLTARPRALPAPST